MELVNAGSLESFLEYKKANSEQLLDEECSCIMKQILKGISCIHDKDIVHRDLKPQNILMKSFTNIEESIKIADFGLGIKGDYMITENSGTILFMAPEQVTHSSYMKEVDIWAAGIIMYMLISSKHPLLNDKDNKDALIKKISKPRFTFDKRFSPY